MDEKRACYFCGSTKDLHEAAIENGRIRFNGYVCSSCPGDVKYTAEIVQEQPPAATEDNSCLQQASNLSMLCDYIREAVKDDQNLFFALMETLEGWLGEKTPKTGYTVTCEYVRELTELTNNPLDWMESLALATRILGYREDFSEPFIDPKEGSEQPNYRLEEIPF